MNWQEDTNITAEEIFRGIDKVLHSPDMPLSEAGRRLHSLLELTCDAGTRDSREAFGNLFAKVDFLCRRFRITNPSDVSAIQRMRRHSNHPESLLPEDLPYDCRALSLLASAVFSTDIPHDVASSIPHQPQPHQRGAHVDYRCLRCIIDCVEGRRFTAHTDTEGHEQVTVDFSDPQSDYLVPILRSGMQVNLIDAKTVADGKALQASPIVVEPDVLIDISSIARCFTPMGHHPLAYTLNRLQPNQPTQPILLGNFAGNALNDIINAGDGYQWTNTLKENFRTSAVDYCTCTDFNPLSFKDEARSQASNIQGIVDELFGGSHPFQRSHAIIEPSFICEELGLQGRADLMTTDMKLLVEQKSGKNYNIQNGSPNAFGSFQKEDHYVQLLLYYGVLHQNFHVNPRDIDFRLLYSKYPLPGGLVVVNYFHSLFLEAMAFRNRVVATAFHIARHGFGSVAGHINATTLNEKGDRSKLFFVYLKPPIDKAEAILQGLSPLAKAYFCRMATFVYNEQLASRLGTLTGVGQSTADLWNMPLTEKKEQGCIFTDLQLTHRERDDNGGGYNLLRFSVPPQGQDFLPNFRPGDPIYLYSYPTETEPDVRHSILLKGSLISFDEKTLTVHLRDGQQNAGIFDRLCVGHPHASFSFAIEHADYGGGSLMKGLFEMASAPPDRIGLLLGQRKPRRDTNLTLTQSYSPDYDEIVLKAKQALDYFLLVGPPGTGKTSMALQFIVREALSAPTSEGTRPAVLLLAYTNRAVDEICGMLEKAGIGYLRIGNEYVCDERYRHRMLSHVIGDNPRLDNIRQTVAEAQVVVATTLSMQAQQALLGVKHFQLAVVDEAGQILEPGLIGLLASHRSGRCDIDKFILMGDYKQLPAVVQQGTADTPVNEPLLNDIGIRDCRDSLFERLIRWEHHCGRTQFVGVLHKQGRMHPDIADFPDRMFYDREQLECVPLQHQLEKSLPYSLPSADYMDDALKEHRMIFIPSEDNGDAGSSDKVNPSEALIVADMLRRIYRFTAGHFDPQSTVGVIVPYRNQIAMIRRATARLGIPVLQQVSIDTVERYQGSQRDIIIYSFTVTHRYQLDFLTANSLEEDGRTVDRKLNVAITRARRQLILTGHEPTLRHNAIFASLIDYIADKGGLVRRKDL